MDPSDNDLKTLHTIHGARTQSPRVCIAPSLRFTGCLTGASWKMKAVFNLRGSPQQRREIPNILSPTIPPGLTQGPQHQGLEGPWKKCRVDRQKNGSPNKQGL